jgi:hypothetical protein
MLRELEKERGNLIEYDIEERIVATQDAFNVAASVHFEREGLLHV